LLIAFGVLPIRGVLYTLTSNTALLVAIQIMDGVGAGIFGVVSVLVIANLTRGTGRFKCKRCADPNSPFTSAPLIRQFPMDRRRSCK